MAYKKVTTTTSLPPLPKLRVRRPVLNKSTNQCLVIMTSLLNCWAANGDGAASCLNFEKDLKNCMETHKPEKEQLSTINYHASRLYPKFKGTVTD
ncbi:37S ribosomal protein Mrp10p, mitochondrial [[Candida] jaroonii]|uniref:37S ribosomal protein Mrp10p, mitochondrial n=1 Tax=[Candida] jaroonii TaxID=467808 RepID=A0ACA9Y2J1_9ASCO|nr:37S ribosomal protein Mrp10p, mitochondrial [[Candida] jaroonii]